MTFFGKKAAPIDVASLGQWQLIAMRFRKHWLARGSVLLLSGIYTLAVFANFFSPNDPMGKDNQTLYAPPTVPRFSFSRGLYIRGVTQYTDPVSMQKIYVEDPARDAKLVFFAKGYSYKLAGLIPWDRHFLSSADPETKFLLFGADKFGRDILARILIGARISLSIGLVAIFVSFFLGILVGGVSGYFGGWIDNLLQRGIEILNAFPKLPLWLALGAALPRHWSSLEIYFGVTLILSLMGWTGMARVVRGKILSLREEDYALAAKLMGANDARVIFLHLVPGFMSHIIVSLSMTVPGMILGETGMSFLGLGLKPPTVSWGVMLQDCMSMQVVKNYPWLLLPTVFIILTVLCFNFVGDGMRDAADPYASR